MNKILFILYTAFSVVGLVVMKKYLPTITSDYSCDKVMLQNVVYFSIGGVFYILSFVLWLAILRQFPLSLAYPVAIGMTLTLTSITSVIYLAEPITFNKVLGTILIIAGIVSLFISPGQNSH